MYFNYWKDGGQRTGIYLANDELISKFRFFDGETAYADAKSDIEDYLDVYQNGPISKADMLARLNDGRPIDAKLASKFRIQRKGKDADDLFWSFGKVHGLENIIFLDEEKAKAAIGDPWKL